MWSRPRAIRVRPASTRSSSRPASSGLERVARGEPVGLLTEKVISLLRRIYNVVVIDSPPAITDTTLAFLDDADSILSIITPDRNSVRSGRLAGQAFVAAGMEPQKMMLVMNRAGSPGVSPEQLAAELGRLPDVDIPDDPQLIGSTTFEGVPFVLAQPKAKASQQIMGIAQRLTAPASDAPRRPSEPTAAGKSS